MPNVLTNFLVGVGFDYDMKGARDIGSGIDSIKSKALQLGSVVAGAFGIKALTTDFAQSRDELGKFSEVFGVLPSDVFALGKALEQEGGSVDAFMSQLSQLERMRAGILVGDVGFISQAGKAGITDTSIITNAENATDAYIALADVFQRLSQQERINAAAALGFDDASIRLLSQGSDAVRVAVARQKEIRDVTEEMTNMSAEFNRQLRELGGNVGNFADKISTAVLPAITDIVSATNSWVDVNRKLIGLNIDKTISVIGDNLGTVSVAGGLLASGGLLAGLAGMARYIPIIGSGIAIAASSAARLSVVGAGVTVGASLWDWTADDVRENLGLDLPEWVFKPVGDLFGNDAPVGGASFSPSDMPKPLTFTPQSSGNGSTSNTQQISFNISLDSQLLDKRIVKVVDGQAELTYQDIKSTVEN